MVRVPRASTEELGDIYMPYNESRLSDEPLVLYGRYLSASLTSDFQMTLTLSPNLSTFLETIKSLTVPICNQGTQNEV